MSLEEALAANTAALLKLHELFSAQAEVAPSNPASSSPTSPQILASEDAAVLEQPAPHTEPEDVIQEDIQEVTKDEVAAAITRLANGKGRDVAVQVLSLFGIKKVSEANPSDYAAILTACQGA